MIEQEDLVKTPAGDYTSGDGCRVGTPENPSCASSLRLAADGTGWFVGDDIIENATWTATGDDVVVVVGDRSMRLRITGDGRLVDEHGVAWKRGPGDPPSVEST